MTTFLQLALLLSIILLSAKLAGYVSVRLGQPSVPGEIRALHRFTRTGFSQPLC
jgi:Kef-type K+ transport system membrane component KefB